MKKRILISFILSLVFIYGCTKKRKENERKEKLNVQQYLQNDNVLFEKKKQHFIALEGSLFSITFIDSLCRKEISIYKEIEASRRQLIDWLDAEEKEFLNNKYFNNDSYLEFNNALSRYYKLCSKEIYNDKRLNSLTLSADSSQLFYLTRSLLRKEIFELEELSLKEILFRADTTYLKPSPNRIHK